MPIPQTSPTEPTTAFSLESVYLRAASGAPTLTGLLFVNHQGEQILFDPGPAHTDAGSLTLTSSFVSIPKLWEAATGGSWSEMQFHHASGVLPTTVGGTGVVEMRTGSDVASAPIAAFHAGETFSVGNVPESALDAYEPVKNVAHRAFSVTPNDSSDLAIPARCLYCGTGGDLKVTTLLGDVVTFRFVQAGFFPVAVKRVWSTGTTATNIVGLQ